MAESEIVGKEILRGKLFLQLSTAQRQRGRMKTTPLVRRQRNHGQPPLPLNHLRVCGLSSRLLPSTTGFGMVALPRMPHQQGDHVCRPWVGLVSLLNPLRRVLYTPESILGPYVRKGMTVIEPGPGMGFFTLEAARLVGSKGKVVALDIQETMLQTLRRRAERAGLVSRLELRLTKPKDFGIRRKRIADFFLAFAMVHEVPDPVRFFEQAYDTLKAGGKFLFAEPRGHVSEQLFERELGLAVAAGFKIRSRPSIRWSWAALLTKGSEPRGKRRPATTRRLASPKKR